MKRETQNLHIKFYARAVRRPGGSKKEDLYYRAEIVSDYIAKEEDVITEFAELANLDYDEAARLHDLHNQAYGKILCEHKKLSIKGIGLICFSLKSALMKGKRGITSNVIKGIRVIFYPAESLRAFFFQSLIHKNRRS